MMKRLVWLASYPKSGNTWMRAIFTALSVHPHFFDINQLSSGAQPLSVAESVGRLGLDSRWLDVGENDQLRTALIRSGVAPTDDQGDQTPILRKTHEVWRPGREGSEPLPADVTRAALLLVRDPRDVACSFAPFFGMDLDQAIDTMGSGRDLGDALPVFCLTAQPWGSWSEHVRSWRSPEIPFPVHVIRYEDLRGDAAGTLEPVFSAIGLRCTRDQLEGAIDRARLERLRDMETVTPFREIRSSVPTFFRSGHVGAWRAELSDAQVAAIEADHGDVMEDLGYELSTPEAKRRALAASRDSVRRRGDALWTNLPPHLGLEVRLGEVPDELAGATHLRPWLQITPTAARVQFSDGRALLVENGRTVTIEWTDDPAESDADPSWLVQGWAVTLASLQRGNLCLHASTVRIGDEIVAIAGHQGAGKSTTAMGLRARGHRLLVDDTTVIDFRDDGAWTTPYTRNVHLMRDTADALGVDHLALPALAGRNGKVAFRAEDPPIEPCRIDRIVVLTLPEEATEVTLDHVGGAERVPLLRHHVVRRGLAPAILGQASFFGLLARLADVAPVQLLRRSAHGWSLDAVLDAIEAGEPGSYPVDG
jgi:aryl sulfotransferase